MSFTPGTPYYPPPAMPTQPRRRTGLRVVVVLGLVVLLVLVAGGAYIVIGAAIAGADRVAAEGTLERARQDNNQVYSLITSAPNVATGINGSNVDFAKLKGDMDTDLTRISQGRATLAGDMPRLREQSSKLGSDSGSFLLAPQRTGLDSERKRVDATLTAFTAGDQALAVAGEEVRFAGALITAGDLFDQVGKRLSANDVSGALGLYAQLDPAVQQVVQLAKSPNIPQQLQSLSTALATTAADIKQLLQAVQARNLAAVRALTPKIEADSRAAESYDQSKAQAQTEQIFQPYQARYEAALKSAGFKLV